MDNTQEPTYKKIKLHLWETNHHGYKRLLKEFDEKLAKTLAKNEQQLVNEIQVQPIIDKLKRAATDVREKIENLQNVSEPDAIQALACLGKALDDPSASNMEQLNLLIANLSSFQANDLKEQGIAQQRKALALGLGTLTFYLATITAIILFPLSIPLLLVITASIELPIGYFYSKIQFNRGQQKEQLADSQQIASPELGQSMKALKEALPKAEIEDKSKSSPTKKA